MRTSVIVPPNLYCINIGKDLHHAGNLSEKESLGYQPLIRHLHCALAVIA